MLSLSAGACWSPPSPCAGGWAGLASSRSLDQSPVNFGTISRNVFQVHNFVWKMPRFYHELRPVVPPPPSKALSRTCVEDEGTDEGRRGARTWSSADFPSMIPHPPARSLPRYESINWSLYLRAAPSESIDDPPSAKSRFLSTQDSSGQRSTAKTDLESFKASQCFIDLEAPRMDFPLSSVLSSSLSSSSSSSPPPPSSKEAEIWKPQPTYITSDEAPGEGFNEFHRKLASLASKARHRWKNEVLTAPAAIQSKSSTSECRRIVLKKTSSGLLAQDISLLQTHSLNHLLTHPLTHSLGHQLTHSLTQ